MRTQTTGRRWTGKRAWWAGTAAAALAVITATGGGVGNAAVTAERPSGLPAASSVPDRASFDYYGTFANVKSAPAGTPAIGGTGAMVVLTHATTTSITATGLDPKAVYIADVHNSACFLNEGGGQFMIDRAGPQAPPNEIWLYPITVSPTGVGRATTIVGLRAGPRAKSIIIHLLRAAGADKDEANPPKLACADLPRTTS